MFDFPALVHLHRIRPGRLMHVGPVGLGTIPGYYEAGYSDITVFYADREHIKSVRTRFPGVNAVSELPDTSLPAQTCVIDMPGYELSLVQLIPAEVELLAVSTSASDNTNGASSYDLLTEVTTTRGFVEIDRQKRADGATIDVAFVNLMEGS